MANDSVELQKVIVVNTGETANNTGKSVIAINKLYANSKELLKSNQQNKGIFNSIKNSLSIKNLQSSLASAFTRSAKAFTAPFKAIGTAFTSSIGRLKGFLTNLSPIRAIGAIKDKFNKTKEKVQQFLGRDLESLQKKFFGNWADPRKVLTMQWKLNQKLWERKFRQDQAKERRMNKSNKLSIFRGPTNYEMQMNYYRAWNKPAKVAKIWANEFEKNKKIQKVKGPEATLGQVFGALIKEVKGIGTALKTLLNPIGIGLAIAIGITPGILLLSGALALTAYLITQTIEKLGMPIVNVLTDIGSKIGAILDRILSLIDSPISTIASGVKGAVNKVGAWLKDDGKAHEGQELNTMIFRIYQDWTTSFFNPIKSDLAQLVNKKEATPETPSYEPILSRMTAIYKGMELGYLKPFTKDFKELSSKAISFFEMKNYNDNRMSGKVMEEFADTAKKVMSKTFESAKNIYKDLRGGVKEVWNKLTGGTKAEPGKQAINTGNPFSEMVSSFNEMKVETLNLLNSINKAVVEISARKLQVNGLNTPGSANASDTKQMTQPLQVVARTDTKNIETIMSTISTDIKSIVKNTALTDSGEVKKNSVTWSLE